MGKQKAVYLYNGYYSALTINEVLIRAMAGVNLRNIMLGERSQLQKNTYCMIPLILNANLWGQKD